MIKGSGYEIITTNIHSIVPCQRGEASSLLFVLRARQRPTDWTSGDSDCLLGIMSWLRVMKRWDSLTRMLVEYLSIDVFKWRWRDFYGDGLMQQSPIILVPWTGNGSSGWWWQGERIVSHTQLNPAHEQMELCVVACHFHGPVSNGLRTGRGPQTEGWGPLVYWIPVQSL